MCFLGGQWKENTAPHKICPPCFGSFRTRVHLPGVHHSLLFPPSHLYKRCLLNFQTLKDFLGPVDGRNPANHLGCFWNLVKHGISTTSPSTGELAGFLNQSDPNGRQMIWPVETTEEKTLNAHEATVTSLSASPPTAPYDPRLVSCSKAWNKAGGYQKWKWWGLDEVRIMATL